MGSAAPPSLSTVMSPPGAVYASADALYVSVRQKRAGSGGWYTTVLHEDEASSLHKFELLQRPPSVSYAASGIVKGRVLNQFALDERGGRLRIATTTSRAPSPDAHGTLTILEQDGHTLRTTGQVDNLAPTEDIRSVRFSEDVAFIVTFKKTDPLYAISLTDPSNRKCCPNSKCPAFLPICTFSIPNIC